MRDAVARLGIDYPVLIDSELELWQDYENEGWPARYLFDGRARLFDYHYGEGGYAETELAIQELLGVEREPLAPLRPEDAPGALLRAADRGSAGRLLAARMRPAACGRCSTAQGESLRRRRPATAQTPSSSRVAHPGAYPLIEHERHTAGVLELELGEGVRLPRDVLHAGRGLSAAMRAVQEQPLAAAAGLSPRRARRCPASRGSRRAWR